MIGSLRHHVRFAALFAALGGLALAALELQAAPEAGGAATSPQTASSGSDHIRTGWEYSPYRIAVYLQLDADPEWTAARRAALLAEIESRSKSLVGGLWQLKAVEAPAELHWNSVAEIERVTTDLLPAVALDGDKVYLLGLGSMQNGRRELRIREYDVRTENWGMVHEGRVPAGIGIGEIAVEALARAFCWVGRIDEVTDQGTAIMRVRGGGLPVAASSRLPIAEDCVFHPIIRHFDAAGRTVKNGVFPVDWTWLLPTGMEGATAKCLIATGVQDPLELKFDGRTEYLTLAAPSRGGDSTELLVKARGSDRPIEGADVFVLRFDGKVPILAGRTDAHGVISFQPREFEMVFVRSGDDLLARFPLLPGFQPKVVVHVDDNGRRLESGALVDRLNDELLDLAVQQTMLKGRFQRQVVHGNLDEAQKTLTALQSLKSSDAFLKAMDDERAALSQVTADQAAADWLDKQLAEIKPLATKFLLDSQGLSRLESVLASVRTR